MNGATSRRHFLKSAAIAAAAGAAAISRHCAEAAPSPKAFVDTNVWISHWPLRRLPLDETPKLVAKLRANGVTEAWVASFDALLHRDIAAVNARLVEECRRHGRGLLVPFGLVNPKLPDWEEDLRRCAKLHRMPGIRVHPSYHGYRLDDPAFASLLQLAAQHGLLVQLSVVMEDRRMMHPLLQVEPPDLKPLPQLLKNTPGLRLQLLNWPRPSPAIVNAGQVFVEIAMLEGVGAVEKLLAQLPAERVLFGSYAPMFYFEAASLKLKESNLTPQQLQAIRCANAQRLLARR